MKRSIVLFSIILLALAGFSQEKLNDLKAPTSPAATVMGVQPQAVLSPKSYEALETAVYSNFLNDNGNFVLPDNFALELTPYWLKDHGLSLDEYLYPKTGWDQLKRNSSISLATTPSYQLGDSSKSSAIGLGYRTTFYIYNKKDKEEVLQKKDALFNNQVIVATLSNDLLSFLLTKDSLSQQDIRDSIGGLILDAFIKSGQFSTYSQAQKVRDMIVDEVLLMPAYTAASRFDYHAVLMELVQKYTNSQVIFDKFKAYIKQRNGFSLDLAYACFLDFPGNKFSRSYVPRQSVWITPTYRFSGISEFLKVMAVVRWEHYNEDFLHKYFQQDLIYHDAIDFGGALSGEYKMFSLQFEVVGRAAYGGILTWIDEDGGRHYSDDKNFDIQYIGTISYNLAGQIVLTYSIGNRFDPVQNPGNTLVSLLTLNFGFGSPTKADLDLNK